MQSQGLAFFVVEYVTNQFSQVTGGEISYDNLEGDLHQGLVLDNIELKSSDQTWLRIPKATLHLDPFPLFFGLVAVKEIHLERPVLILTGERDNLSIPALGQKDRDGIDDTKWKILGRLDTFYVTDGTVEVVAPQPHSPPQILLDRISFNGESGFSSFPGVSRWYTWISLQEGSTHLVQADMDVTFSARKVVVRPDRLEVKKFFIRSDRSEGTFELLYPWDKTKSHTISWDIPKLSLLDFGMEDFSFTSTGKATSVIPPPSLTNPGQTRQIDAPVAAVYLVEQNFSWLNYHFSMQGQVSGLVDNLLQFDGNVGFEQLPVTPFLQNILSHLPQGLAGVERVHKISDILDTFSFSDAVSGHLYINSRKNPETPYGIKGRLFVNKGGIGEADITAMEVPFSFTAQKLTVPKADILTSVGGIGLQFNPPATWPESPGGDIELGIRATDLDLSKLLRKEGLPEKLSGGGELRLRGGKMYGSFTVEPFRYKGVLFTSAAGKFIKDDSGILFQDMSLGLDEKFIEIQGGIQENRFNLLVSLNELPVHSFAAEYSGLVSATGRLNGPVADPRFDGDITVSDLAGEKLQADFLKGTLTVRNLYTPHPETLWRWQGRHISFGAITFLDEASLEFAEEGHGVFRLTRAAINKNNELLTLAAPATVVVSNELLKADHLELTGEHTSLRLVMDWRKEKSINANLYLSGLPLHSEKFPVLPFDLNGEVSLHLNMWGNPEMPQADVSLEYTTAEERFIRKFSSSGTFADKLLQLSGELLTRDDETMQFQLNIPTALSVDRLFISFDPAALDGRFVLNGFNMNHIPVEMPVDISGRLNAELVTSPSVSELPHLNGTFQLAEAEISYKGAAIEFSEGQGSFSYDGSQVILHQFEASSKDGNLEASGRAFLSADNTLQRYDFILASGGYSFSYKGAHQALVKGQMHLFGTIPKPNIKAELTLLQAESYQAAFDSGFGREDEIVVFESREDPEGTQTTGPYAELLQQLEHIGLDVDLDIPGNAWLHAGNLKLELKGRIHALNNNDGFQLSGELYPGSGKCSVGGREFTVEEGVVAFSGKNSLEPTVSATAVCNLPGAVISAVVSGTVQNPHIRLVSDPWMPEENIIASIMFGKPVQDLQRDNPDAFQGGVASVLGGSILKKMRQMTGNQELLESFGFYSGKDGAGEESVGIGKYLSNNLLVSYEYSFDNQNPGQIHMEYKLKGGFSVESMFLDPEKTGLDLFWKKDF